MSADEVRVNIVSLVVRGATVLRSAAQASLVTDALRTAWFRRHPKPGLVFHSDRGSRYCSGKVQDALSSYGMRSSLSRKGDCWDNAPTESLGGV